jgi:hypothetical protein
VSLVALEHAAVGEHDLRGEQLIAGEAAAAAEHPDPAAQRQPRDPDRRADAGRDRKIVPTETLDQLADARSGAHPDHAVSDNDRRLDLRLMLTRPYGERRDADAVAEELYGYFASRRVRGSWYRLTGAEVRERLGQRASLEAPARARAAAEAVAARERRVALRRGGEPVRARTEKQLAYERRRRRERTRKQQRAARLLGQGMTRQAVAAELGVTTRTLRNWKAAPAFQRERERHHKQTARQRTAPPHSKLKPSTRRDAQDARRDRPRRSRPTAEQTPAIDVDQTERERPALAAEEQANGADRPRAPAASHHGGVPIFADTPDGHAARLAYDAARKLNNPPNSLFDYHDAKRGLEPPAERRAREQRDNPPPR